MYKTSLAGYDVRELWLDTNSQWPDKKKQDYLLCQDVIKPLSVDGYVWYSVFSEKTVPRIWNTVSLQETYHKPEWINTFDEARKLAQPDIYTPRGIWSNLDDMTGYLQEFWGDDWKPCAIIAMQDILLEDEVEDNSIQVKPSFVDPNWTFLGYDIADYELYTGLSDGVIPAPLSRQIKTRWLENLNEYHLFRNIEIAFDYIQFADDRIPSHRPFHVYGLYLIETKRTLFPAK